MSVLSQALGDGKARKARDLYPTIDPRAIAPLIAHVPAGTVYAEPCAGEGDLMQLLDHAGLICDWACDIEPQRRYIARQDALQLTAADLGAASVLITNPMWDRPWLHRFIKHLAHIAPTWLLFDANWMQTAQAAVLGPRYCTDIVAVGRLRWFPPPGRKLRIAGESPADYEKRCRKGDSDPPTDCAWYRFSTDKAAPTRWHWRQGKEAVPEAQGLLI